MARNPKVTKRKGGDRRPTPNTAAGRPRRGRPKVCIFCREHATWVDYKDIALLRRFLSDRGRIKARAATGTCAQHQRDVATAVKTARELALLPYAVRLAQSEHRGGRGGGGRRGSGNAPPTPDTPTPDAAHTSTQPPPDDGPDDQNPDVTDQSASSPV